MASNRGLNPHVVGRFFRDEFTSETIEYHVLIPMWWGGFSEQKQKQPLVVLFSLNPHVVGRFFRVQCSQANGNFFRLNPHVVGRFFRGQLRRVKPQLRKVLIPMWWGGFSEPRIRCHSTGHPVLIPMWWGGFSELLVLLKYWSRWLVLIPMWWGGFSE